VGRKRFRSDVIVEGASAHPLRDAYHLLLEMSWPAAFGGIAVAYLLINAVFAVGFMLTGGVANASGSFADAFFFSVQTMGTIGYGAMAPTSFAANILVVVESVVSLIVTALATGIVFARFSRTTAEVVFSQTACISPMDGISTLSFRIGNDRSNAIFDARVSVIFIRTEKTKEGHAFYRMYDVPLVRHQATSLERSFTVMHRIDEKSPLRGATSETCVSDEVEINVSVMGTDDVSLQPVYARHTYYPKDLGWGRRLADILHERPDGKLVLDVRKFHDTVPQT
jgi:inward rectifier potassium channel